MTAKRFKMIENDSCYVMLDNRKPMSKEKIIDLLNELSEENEQLKKELDCFKPLIFETDGKPITLYEKKDGGDVE